ncbi:MAG: peptidylprolyl isomerase [Planctomycetaceae bacterium]
MSSLSSCLPAFVRLAVAAALFLPASGCSNAPVDDAPPILTAIEDVQKEVDQAEKQKRAAEARARAATNASLPDAGSSIDMSDVPEEGSFRVLFETTAGNFTIDVHRDWAPIGAEHFYQLVKANFYNDAGFFRVVPNFMVQFGIAADPATTAKWDQSIKDDPVKRSNLRGFVTYAKMNQPNSRSTQVFINYQDNSRLDRDGFAPFGIVVDGMEVVDKINAEYGERPDQESLRAGGNGYLKPTFPNLDFINSVTIIKDNTASAEPPQN